MKIGSSVWKETIVEGARETDIHVRPGQADQFARHATILKAWNQKINLTTVEDPLEMAVKHYVDAIMPCGYIQPGSRLLDVGSGAGFPGIALKIMIPTLQITLVEATRKKVNFLKHVIRELGLDQIEAIHTRIENLDQCHKAGFDVIVSRAFSDLSKFVTLSLPYLASSGCLIAYKARGYATEIPELNKTLDGQRQRSQQGIDPQFSDFKIKILPFRLPKLNLHRTLLLLQREDPLA